MKANIKLTYFVLLLCSYSFGQLKHYGYKRELPVIKDQWHKVVLPNEIFGKVLPDLSDIRIFGLTGNNDTIEAPYILQPAVEKNSQKEVAFNLINQSKNDRGYYFTFEVPIENSINQIKLEFKQSNFDWRLALEGSQDQKEWYSIIEDYRIISIKNELSDFQFTKVAFPSSKYHYFRILINSKQKPEFISAKLSLNETIDGNFRKYNTHSIKIDESNQGKQTTIDIALNSSVPVCKLKIFVKDTFDYYRPITVQYLADSFKTQKGWKYNYSTLTSGTLNSIEKNQFKFNSTILHKLKVIIENQDNEPLKFDSVVVEGYIHELIARFNDPATYYLVYGNKSGAMPHYDIDRFTDKIPTALTTLTLGDEQVIEKEVKTEILPLFQNKVWLWIIMGVVIAILGWFSLGMMRKR